MRPEAPTPFYATKARGDAALAASGLVHVILRPVLVLAPTAYGGTALLRDDGGVGLAAPQIGSDLRLVVVRDRSAVALNERRQLESVVADENRDRQAVYREIAVANGQPDWEQQIQQTWSQEWIRNARPGWYYQAADGSWKQK